MSSLSGLQAAFKSHLFAGDPRITDLVVDDERLGADLRLAIYRNAYEARLVDALGSDFEALRALMGDDAFGELGRAYVRAHPSTAFSLRWLGRHLSAFLTVPPYSDQADLAELAGFEWALAGAFDAADDPVARESDAAAVEPAAWPALRARLHASVRWMDCRWNTQVRWRAFKDGIPMPPAQPLPEVVRVLIWRQQLTTRFRSLPGDEAAALEAIAGGAPFAGLCETLLKWVSGDQVAVRAASLLKGWLSAGLITALG